MGRRRPTAAAREKSASTQVRFMLAVIVAGSDVVSGYSFGSIVE